MNLWGLKDLMNVTTVIVEVDLWDLPSRNFFVLACSMSFYLPVELVQEHRHIQMLPSAGLMSRMLRMLIFWRMKLLPLMEDIVWLRVLYTIQGLSIFYANYILLSNFQTSKIIEISYFSFWILYCLTTSANFFLFF